MKLKLLFGQRPAQGEEDPQLDVLGACTEAMYNANPEWMSKQVIDAVDTGAYTAATYITVSVSPDQEDVIRDRLKQLTA